MFYAQAPELAQFEVWTSMPERWRRPERSDWADANRGGAPVDSFLEGPVFDRHGNLYVADIPWGRVFRIGPDREWSLVAEYDGEPNGMKFLDDGRLLITDYKNGLMTLDIASGQVAPYLARRNSERFKGVNDLIFDARAICTSPTRARAACTTPPAGCTACAPMAAWTACWTTCPAPTAWRCRPTARCCTWQSRAATACGACR